MESLKLESLHLSWKELIEVRKFVMQYSVADYDSDPESETEPDYDCHPYSK